MSADRRYKCLTPDIEEILDKEIPGWDETEPDNAAVAILGLIASQLGQVLRQHNGAPKD